MNINGKIKFLLAKLLMILVCTGGYILPLATVAQDQVDSVDFQTEAIESVENRPEKMPEIAALRAVPDTTVSKMQKQKAFAYANDPAYWKKEKAVYKKGFWDYVFDFFGSDAVRWIFYTMAAALAIFVLYRIIVVNDLLIFYSSKKKKFTDSDSILAEVNPGIIDQKIAEAIDGKQYNVAVRFLYLKMLYSLNEKNAIQYHAVGTNNEYLNQMSEHKLSKQFRFLTQVYEYVWYGKFNITENQFSLVHDNFKNFQSAI